MLQKNENKTEGGTLWRIKKFSKKMKSEKFERSRSGEKLERGSL